MKVFSVKKLQRFKQNQFSAIIATSEILRQKRRLVLVLALMLIAIFLISCGTNVHVKEDKTLSNVTFQIIGEKNCQPSFEVPLNKTEKWGLVYQSNCSLPPSQLLPLISKLLDIVTKKVDLDMVGSVFWGSIYNSEFSSRLAIAALRSPEWDRKKGQPKSLPLHSFIERLMIEERVFGDVIDIFAQHGVYLDVLSVEKVGILEVKETNLFEKLNMIGVDSNDKLPIDCLVWFSTVEKNAKSQLSP
jgi:hypothetical protein